MNKSTDQKPQLRIQDGVAVIMLGSPEDKAIILTEERMRSLDALLDSLHADIKSKKESLTGVIFTSPSNISFCVGADINAIKDVTDPKEGRRLAAQGQSVFQKIEDLPVPSVAAIHGHCVGGGCELSLACDYRLITDAPNSKIGLPETKLGILPGFGGTQRLPKIIGLPKALDIVLSGKVVPAKKARALGLVDGVVKTAGLSSDALEKTLLEAARTSIKKGKRTAWKLSLADRFLSHTALGRYICKSTAGKAAARKTKGQYPAIPRSLSLCVQSFTFSGMSGYEKEAEALGELITTPVSKALVHIFFLTENAGKLGKQDISDPVSSIGLIGAGVMGRGIASVSLKAGYECSCFDLSEDARKALRTHVQGFIDKSRSLGETEKKQILDKLSLYPGLKDIPERGLFIEAAAENLEIKRKLFSELAETQAPECILASNTSSLSLSEIFNGIPNPDRTIGIHFFNPVEKMPLVELVRTQKTSDKTLIQAARFVSRLGKYPVVVEDVPGFLVNRVLTPFLAEASLLLQEGAGFRDVEQAATRFGFPMGPFRLIDEVGLDIAAKVEEILSNAYGERMQGAEFLKKTVEKKLLGKKGGTGFYLHEGKKAEPNEKLLSELGIKISGGTIARDEITDRLVLSMVNEAVLSYDEGVAGTPGREAADQIDLASIMGFGFPPFRGGILFYLRKSGIKDVHKRMNEFKDKSPRLKPARSIAEEKDL
jgi:3-hydroxyacyl-CoA dehydrogenase / enoyl-CoA hydratase / 3-hydroxybutyryl-CoA epimerase